MCLVHCLVCEDDLSSTRRTAVDTVSICLRGCPWWRSVATRLGTGATVLHVTRCSGCPTHWSLNGWSGVPVHRHLVVAKGYKYQFAADDMNSIAEMVAVDLTLKYIEEALFEMVKGSSAVKISGGETEKFEARLRESRDVVMNLRREAFERYAQAVLNVERVALAEETLAAHGQMRFSKGFHTEEE